MEVMDTIQDLVEQAFDHSLSHSHWFLGRLCCPMELDNVPKIVFRVVEEQPDFSVRVREEDADQVDYVDVL